MGEIIMELMGISANIIAVISFLKKLFDKNRNKKELAARLIFVLVIGTTTLVYICLTKWYIQVPNLVDCNIENAKQTLNERGYQYDIVPQDYSSLDKVYRQEPAEGYMKSNEVITLFLVETGEKRDNVPGEQAILNNVDDNNEEDEINSDDENTEDRTEKEEFDTTYESYFTLSETHSPSDAMNDCYIDVWDGSSDKDVRGVTYQKGILYYFTNTLALLGGNSADKIESDLRFVIIPESPNPQKFTAKIVLHADSVGTDATAAITVLVDGNEYWTSEEILDGNSIEEIPVNIDLSEMQSYFTIHVEAMPYGDGIKFGIVDYQFQ